MHWFESIEQKSKCFFIQFHIIEFYSSITEKILEYVIIFSKQHVDVAEMFFEEIGFKIETETNLRIVNFLDVTFNLINSTYRPYRKPNDNLLYLHTSSNRPPQIIKHLSDSIDKRLSNNSSNKQVFNSAEPENEKVLKDSG